MGRIDTSGDTAARFMAIERYKAKISLYMSYVQGAGQLPPISVIDAIDRLELAAWRSAHSPVAGASTSQVLTDMRIETTRKTDADQPV